MKSAEGPFLVLALLILALGIGFAGVKVNEGLKDFRSYDQYVTVKGLAEREVKSDMAVWPMAYVETGDDLPALQDVMEERGKEVESFLKKHGLKDEEISKARFNVQDRFAQSYGQRNMNDARYILTQTYMVRTQNVDALERASQDIGELIKQGVVLSQGGEGPTYLFTRLNDVKPDMIAEATKNARDAAKQFAADSGAEVGSIRRAYQGIFQILPRDDTYTVSPDQQIYKRIRVVSTLDFYLE